MSAAGSESSTKEPKSGSVEESGSVTLSKNASWSKSKKSGAKHKNKKDAGDAGTVELFEGDDAFQGVPEYLTAKWDPCDLNEHMNTPSPGCIRRIKNDIMAIYSDPPPGLCVVPDPNNITKIHALLTGPFDTPYEGGFFYFLIRFPPDYPINPPRVRLMTTGGGTVRFNPNLYKNGKVCLSILGTWAGPSWSPAQTLSTVLISIQSLMNEKPYHNEPGFKHERTSGDAKHYNDIIQHEAIRVAVCDMIEGNCRMPDSLRVVMESSFPDYYRYYLQVCENHIQLDGMAMNDPFGDSRPRFDFKSLLRRLKAIHNKLDRNLDNSAAGGDGDDDVGDGDRKDDNGDDEDESEEDGDEQEKQHCLRHGESSSSSGGGGGGGAGGGGSS